MQQRYDFLLRKFSKVSITLETSVNSVKKMVRRMGFIGYRPRLKPRSMASKYSNFCGRTPQAMSQRAAGSLRTRVQTALANSRSRRRMVGLNLRFKRRGPGGVVTTDKPTTKVEYVTTVS